MFYSTAIAFLMIVLLSACGGSTGGGSSGGGSGSGGNPASDTLALGSFSSDGQFKAGEISTSRTTLTAGQSATLSVAMVNADNDTPSDEATIAFTSPCISNSLAEIDPKNPLTAGGRANVTYTARGCDSSDAVTATTVINSTTLRAQTTIDTQAAPPGSIVFDATSAEIIGLKGTGGALPEQASVTFRITNTAGGPAPNQAVSFDLNTRVGGIELSNDEAVTDANGLATTTVTSGTVAAIVRVTASTINSSGATLSTQSNQLAITTGLPDNDSFTIGARQLNIEGYDRNNVRTEITALLADRFNNPVPDGTSVLFSIEGGAIDGSCSTMDGQCTVEFRSQNPRPANGRVTILATAIGEESFTDANANGRFDAGERYADLPEAYRDDNENGRRDSNEFFLDFNADQNFSTASGSFTGVLRDRDSACNQCRSLNVRSSLVLVLSGSSLIIDGPDVVELSDGPVRLQITVVDQRGQVAAAGTTISALTTQGSIDDPSSFTQDSSNGVGVGTYTFFIEPEGTAGQGTMTITATSPNSETATRLRIPVTETDPSSDD